MMGQVSAPVDPDDDSPRHEPARLPELTSAVDSLPGLARVAVGAKKFDSIREAVALEAVGMTIKPFQDPEFSKRQSEKIRNLIAMRTKEMAPEDFVEMMRSAIKEDEWMLYAHGAIMGAAGGFLHVLIFNVWLAH